MRLSAYMTSSLILASAITGTSVLAGCADESAPNRRGIERPALIQDSTESKTNAEHRELENRKRELPAGGGKEFPGQSKLDNNDLTSRPIALLADGCADMKDKDECGSCCGKPAKATQTPPGMSLTDYRPVMKKGQTAVVPGTGYSIDPSWGSEQPLASADHRPWPVTTVRAETPGVQHNPYYTKPLNWGSTPEQTGSASLVDFVEIPWFYAQLVTVPVQMAINPPLAQNSTHQPIDAGEPKGQAGIYEAYLPATGTVFPAPVPGKVVFTYPFDNQSPERSTGGIQQLEPSTQRQTTITTIPSSQPRPQSGRVIEKK